LPIAIEPDIDALAQRFGIEGDPLSAQMQPTYLAPGIVIALMEETRRAVSRATSPTDAHPRNRRRPVAEIAKTLCLGSRKIYSEIRLLVVGWGTRIRT
jgi:hypothetical protein